MDNIDKLKTTPAIIPDNLAIKLSTPADLEPKDRPLPEMLEWCERQGDIVVMKSGLILASDTSVRSVQNCKIVMTSKGLRPGKIALATQELITLILSAAREDESLDEQYLALTDPNTVSLQQQRLRMLISEAIREQVSDIHIEVRQDVTRIRFRRHGELYLHSELSSRIGRELAAVAFNRETDHAIAHFNPLVPQNASMPLFVDGINVRLRLASLPAHGGFDVVLRVLTIGNEQVISLPELGYTVDQIATIKRAINMPCGAVLVAGPTGSGKTTTLAACMQLVSPQRKIYTIEEPVERLISNATQVPINIEKEDRDFASMGRSALRMDPDIIMLGELRDEETARVMIRAAITGHLVLSTIHTNSATAIVTRLVDMGVSPALLGDPNVLDCLICQRLVPKLCPKCSVPLKKSNAPKANLERWQQLLGDDSKQARTRGEPNCQYCKNAGIVGRTVIAEIVWIDAISRQFIQKCDILGWEQHLRSQGWVSYRDQALNLVRQGICDPLDAERAVGELNIKA